MAHLRVGGCARSPPGVGDQRCTRRSAPGTPYTLHARAGARTSMTRTLTSNVQLLARARCERLMSATQGSSSQRERSGSHASSGSATCGGVWCVVCVCVMCVCVWRCCSRSQPPPCCANGHFIAGPHGTHHHALARAQTRTSSRPSRPSSGRSGPKSAGRSGNGSYFTGTAPGSCRKERGVYQRGTPRTPVCGPPWRAVTAAQPVHTLGLIRTHTGAGTTRATHPHLHIAQHLPESTRHRCRAQQQQQRGCQQHAPSAVAPAAPALPGGSPHAAYEARITRWPQDPCSCRQASNLINKLKWRGQEDGVHGGGRGLRG
jgi:hypothetical protein